MVSIADKKNSDLIDFSIMPSLECNLNCTFCMYSCSPFDKETLDFEKTKNFLKGINWQEINSVGFYGGEPFLNLDLYSKFIELIPQSIPKFTITNGSWSFSTSNLLHIVTWAEKYDLTVFISSTPEHKEHQDAYILDIVTDISRFEIKNDDTESHLLPMGRNFDPDWGCTRKCLRWNKPKRYALVPNGDIIYQSCDGVYPVIGTYERKFRDILLCELYEMRNCK